MTLNEKICREMYISLKDFQSIQKFRIAVLKSKYAYCKE